MKEYKRLTKRLQNGKIIAKDIALANHPKGIKGAMIERLAELEDGIESGEYRQMPIQPRTTIYLIREGNKRIPYKPTIEKVVVEKVILTDKGWYLKHSANSFSETSFRSEGKTWFRTREQAEAKLKELEGRR